MSLEYILSKFQVFLDCHFHQTLDCQKVVFWQTRLQEIVQIVVICCLNHLRKNTECWIILAVQEKMLSWLDFKEHVQSWLMQFLKLCLNLCSLNRLKPNVNLVSNFRPKGWWIPYIKSGVGRSSLSKIFLKLLKDFSLRNCQSNLFHSRMV